MLHFWVRSRSTFISDLAILIGFSLALLFGIVLGQLFGFGLALLFGSGLAVIFWFGHALLIRFALGLLIGFRLELNVRDGREVQNAKQEKGSGNRERLLVGAKKTKVDLKTLRVGDV